MTSCSSTGSRSVGASQPVRGTGPKTPSGSWHRGLALALAALLVPGAAALAQNKTGPSVTGEDALTWHGLTLYGVIDLGLQYETHGAPFSDYRPAASGNIVQKNSRESVFGVLPSNMGQSRVGVQGLTWLNDDWGGVFRLETFFNPQSAHLADSLKSLTLNNGLTPATSSVGLDGSSAGQALQTAFAGLKSKRFGTLTFGRQLTLLTEGTVKYDPNYDSSAFGLLGASGAYQGGGSTEDKRLDSMLKYSATFDDVVHLGVLYKFAESSGSARTAVQVMAGAEHAGLSVDAYYSTIDDAVVASSLSAAQVAKLPKLGYPEATSVSATVSDNTVYALMGSYTLRPAKFFLGVENIRFANPSHPLAAGFRGLGGYTLAFVNNGAYPEPKILNVYWGGARYTPIPHLDLAAAFYGVHQSAYGTGKQAGCSTVAYTVCSGNLEAYSVAADYFVNQHVDVYAGAMYSAVHRGLAYGYPYYTTNVNPTVGARVKF